MDWGKTLYGLKLDDHAIRHQQINAIATLQFDAFVDDWYRFLALDLQLPDNEFFEKAFLICRFEQARAKKSMDFDGCSDYSMRYFIIGHQRRD